MAVRMFFSFVLLWTVLDLLVATSSSDVSNYDFLKPVTFLMSIRKFRDSVIKRPLATRHEQFDFEKNQIRNKRDLAYAKQLLDLLLTVENILEKKYGTTEPQCQLRATCEIHRRNINSISSPFKTDRTFIKLVSEMRREIRNPRVVPMAKYVFEYYEEAAERGEKRCDCGQLYDRCPRSIDDYSKITKSKTHYGSYRSLFK